MKAIQKYVDLIDEELEGAKDYAECYLMHKSKSEAFWSSRYKEMAEDELKHAMYIHERVVGEIAELARVYTAPVEMEEKWEESHKRYVERVAWIKQMLSM